MAVQRGRSQIRDAKNNEVHDVQNNSTSSCVNGRETVSAQCLLSAARTKLPDFFNIL